LKSELISYATNKFLHEIKGDKVLFYSKRLNIYVYEKKGCKYAKYLNDGHELYFGNSYTFQLKSLQIDDREVLRIFTRDDNITLFTFFNDNPVIKSVYKT
jgi:hypothetical protein